jgi:hypothetical protein
VSGYRGVRVCKTELIFVCGGAWYSVCYISTGLKI